MAHGPQAKLYNLFHLISPGFKAMRVPSRIGLGYLFAMAGLAAFGLQAWLASPVAPAFRRVGLGVLFVVLLVENHVAVPSLPVPFEAAPVSRYLAEQGHRGPLALLPLNDQIGLQLFHSLEHRRPLFNGRSSFTPEPQKSLYEAEQTQGPSLDIFRAIRKLGVADFVIVRHNREWMGIFKTIPTSPAPSRTRTTPCSRAPSPFERGPQPAFRMPPRGPLGLSPRAFARSRPSRATSR